MKYQRSSKQLRVIYYFIILWLLIGLGMVVLPIHSKFGHDLEVFVICVIFVTTISFSAVFWFQNTPRFIERSKHGLISINKILFVIRFSVVATIVGNIFVAIERVLVRGIDYSEGLRNARYQWLANTVQGSAIGKIGNLLIPFSFCALFMSLYHWEIIETKYRIIGVLMGFGGEFGLAILNGGRSNILLTIEFAFAVCVIRKYHGKRLIPKFRGKLIWGVAASVVLVRYVISIFFAFSNNTLDYLYRLSNMLGTTVDSSYKGHAVINVIIEIFLYLFHGINYIGAQIEYGGGIADISHNMTLRGVMTILDRIPGINYQSQLPSFDGGGGNFMALPGQLLYDYTFILFIPICILIGVFVGEMLKVLNKHNKNLSCTDVVFVITVMLVLFHSAIGMAIGFSYYFFMVFALFAMEVISLIKYRKVSSWTAVNSMID